MVHYIRIHVVIVLQVSQRTSLNSLTGLRWKLECVIIEFTLQEMCTKFRTLFPPPPSSLQLKMLSGADPGFPVGGGVNRPGAPTYDFAEFSKNYMKLKKTIRQKGEGCVRRERPPHLRSAIGCVQPVADPAAG